MVNWSCASPSCYNNVKTKKYDGSTLKYHRIPQQGDKLQHYVELLKTDPDKLRNCYICEEHWSDGKSYPHDLADIIVPDSQIQIHKEKYRKAKLRLKRKKLLSKSDKRKLKILKLKKIAAQQYPCFT